ncbi:MAG: GNAT family N-acetyltransferase [Phycisphaerales bacterium]|nr:GNAT family N-acetyltransferase [Phycisphaerales bacterium]
MPDQIRLCESERVFVRRLDTDDLDDLYQVYSDPVAMQWVGDGSPITLDESIKWIEVTLQNYQQRGYGMFAAVEILSDQIIGFCGLVHPDGQQLPELKYAYRKEYWGQGFASEIAGKVLEYATKTLGHSEIIATIAPENSSSIRVVEKLGMVRSDPRKEDDGTITEVYIFRTSE